MSMTDQEIDAQAQQDSAPLQAAHDDGLKNNVMAGFQAAAAAGATTHQDTMGEKIKHYGMVYDHFIADLPTNITTGVIDAAVSAADTVKWGLHEAKLGGQAVADTVRYAVTGVDAQPAEDPTAAAQDPLAAPPAPKAPEPPHAFDNVYDVAKSHILAFRNQMVQQQGATDTIDDITRGVAQVAVPFAGYAKLIGGLKGVTSLGTVARTITADALTNGTVLEAHAGRAADLIALGQHTEGKLGDALRTIAPDGSLVNAYISYMTDRSNESEAEGRWKNIVDGWVSNAATAGLIKSASTALKGGTAIARYTLQNAGAGPVGMSAQRGHIVFHGSGQPFPAAPDNPLGAFSNDHIGSGEGHQVYGFGHYFAEHPEVAGSYARQVALLKHGNLDPNRGALYHVDIPDEKVANMLHWDKPMSQQSAILDRIPQKDKTAIESVMQANGIDASLSELKGSEFSTAVNRAINEGVLQTGHPSETNIEKLTSQYLDSKGIPGIRYLDKGSRHLVDSAGGQGTHNIVLFNPKHATIVKKQ